MNTELNAKFLALQESGTFAEELDKVESPEGLQNVLAAHGIELTMDEIKELMDTSLQVNNDELSEEQLDDVAGGVPMWLVIGGKWVLKQVAGWLIKKGIEAVYNYFKNK